MTPLPESIDARLLARYLDGTATAEEREAVQAWIGEDPERRAAIAELATSWAIDARKSEASYDANAAFARVAAQMPDLHLAPAPARRSKPMSRFRSWHTQSIGAWPAAIGLVVVGAGAWLTIQRSPEDRERAPQAAERIYATARAQRAVIRLSDGTEVTLNAASRLRLAPDFGETKREVHLEGEGYFNVVRDDAPPFTVHTSRGIARDLGTRFSVRAYDEDRVKDLEVIVAEGIVAIAAPAGRDSLVLRAAQLGRVTETGELRVEHNVDLHTRLGWIEGRLEFRNVALRDVLPVLARWYGEDVRVDDTALARSPITATLTGERFDDAVAAIARVLNARVVKQGGQTLIAAPRERGGRE
jgi:transmembrane sensor